ncbi:hypothetical protein LTR09_011710 [Extremus antarcticus]|uniref:O-methyltransferase n=1 Tax=Extremus antarcticus TaxID=702011 RepID=A0AAJ0GA19_9PEZI|nr:hypothetical protein LTR09_011710 [Extremus antarcticus]
MAIHQEVARPAPTTQTDAQASGVTTSVVQLLRSLVAQAPEIKRDSSATSELIAASQALTEALQRPDEVIASVAFSGCRYACVRVALEMGLFEKLAAAQVPLTAAALARECLGADPQLVLRITRTLVGMGFAADAQTQDGSNAFIATPVTRHLTLPSARAGLIFHFDQSFPVLANVAPFFRQNGFQVPQGVEKGVFQYTYNTDEDVYSYWSRDPKIMANFNVFMQGYFGSPAMSYPTSWFPFDQVCLDGFETSRSEYVWVDIGGGKGHHSQELVDRYPYSRGKFVVQDQAEILSSDSNDEPPLSSRIEKMPHNFFEAQPVHGARVYAFENVLHNWSDAQCKTILTHVRNAMTPGYSKLIISGQVIADTNVPLIKSAYDASMLMVFGGAQRGKQQWTDLLAGVGLTVTKFWLPPRHAHDNGIIEADLL